LYTVRPTFTFSFTSSSSSSMEHPWPGGLIAPLSSNGNESLVSMSSVDDYEAPTDVIPPVAVPLPSFSPESLPNVSEPQPLPGAAAEETGKAESRWELRSLKIVRHITAQPNQPQNPYVSPVWNVDLERAGRARMAYTSSHPSFLSKHGQSVAVTIPTPHAQCGVAPDFLPCVPIAQANVHFGQCCRAKLLPPGCQKLCKYDVTQTEIKTALDAGQCGILHVAPIVECASDAHDNTECCRYKQISAKSAPQCEVFCRSGQIRGLGLQHLVCRKVMNELIACHLSGLRL
uniref:DB domain-containing protein n=1 Tax=Gongylonema pulchrum TaxID=637853 RepID=A0A183DYI8_9BILA